MAFEYVFVLNNQSHQLDQPPLNSGPNQVAVSIRFWPKTSVSAVRRNVAEVGLIEARGCCSSPLRQLGDLRLAPGIEPCPTL